MPGIPVLSSNYINIFPLEAIDGIVKKAAGPDDDAPICQGDKIGEGNATNTTAILIKQHTIEESEQRLTLFDQTTVVKLLDTSRVDIDPEIGAGSHGHSCLVPKVASRAR